MPSEISVRFDNTFSILLSKSQLVVERNPNIDPFTDIKDVAAFMN